MRFVDFLRLSEKWRADDAAIFVSQPWSCEADAIIIKSALGNVEQVQQNDNVYSYFLEAFIARDFIDRYAAISGEATERDRCNQLIHYTKDDEQQVSGKYQKLDLLKTFWW